MSRSVVAKLEMPGEEAVDFVGAFDVAQVGGTGDDAEARMGTV